MALAAFAGDADGRDADGDALRGDDLARTGACGVGRSYPDLRVLRGPDGHGRIHLELAQEDAGGRCRSCDKTAHRADEGGDSRIHDARSCHGMVSDGRCHAAIAHDLGRGDDADDRHKGRPQAKHRLAQDLQHVAQGRPLDEAAQERGKENHHARRRNPVEGIGTAAIPLVDEHRRADLRNRIIDHRHQLAGQEQQDEDQHKGQPGKERLPAVDGWRFLPLQHIGKILRGKEPHGSHDGSHGADSPRDARQLGPQEIRYDELGRDIADASCQTDGHHAADSPPAAASNRHHQEGAENA